MVISVVRCGSVAGVDGEQLSLDIWDQVVNPLDSLDGGGFVVVEGRLVDDPFVELLELHVEASVGILCRNDAVDGRICISGSLVVVVESVFWRALGVHDVFGQCVRCANRVFTRNYGDWCGFVWSCINSLCDDRGDKLEDIWAN